MPSLRDIRMSLKESLGALDGFEIYDVIVDNPHPNCIEIVPTDGVTSSFSRGVIEWDLELRVKVRGIDDIEGQGQLDDVISAPTNSIPAILFAKPTAGQDPNESTAGANVSFTISDQGVGDYGADIADGGRVYRATYRVHVLAKGTV